MSEKLVDTSNKTIDFKKYIIKAAAMLLLIKVSLLCSAICLCLLAIRVAQHHSYASLALIFFSGALYLGSEGIGYLVRSWGPLAVVVGAEYDEDRLSDESKSYLNARKKQFE